MQSIVVTGGRRLSGAVRVGGAKNSALKLMAAALLAPGVSRISNVPDISDVVTMSEVLAGLGATVSREGDTLLIDATSVESHIAPYEMVARMRASIVVLGPLLGRLGRARVAMPGGCNIGSRKIDMHIRGLEQLGVEVSVGHGYIDANANGYSGTNVTLDFPSVGATENMLLACVKAPGVTVIENAAREPEIEDLAAFLTSMGASIQGAGTQTITVEGVEELRPAEHAVIGDRIEAGTYMLAGALAGGPVEVTGFDPAHLERVLSKLAETGADVTLLADGASVTRTGAVRPVDIATLPHPGFPTDMQAQFMALLAIAEGSSVITENVFENRFMFADELRRMGADIVIEGHHALVKGVAQLSGAPVRASDLRAGAALVLAGLVADGYTTISGVHHIERGYADLPGKLAALGAEIAVEQDSEEASDDGC